MSDALAALYADVAAGRFPDPDGGFTVVPPDRTTGQHAVLSFTGHAVVATDRAVDEVAALGIDGVGGEFLPAALLALAGPGGWVGVIDVVLLAVGTGAGGGRLREVDHHDDHVRVRYARRTRADVRVLADERGLVTLGRGLGGRTELGVELVGAPHGGGAGRGLVADALGSVPDGAPVFASCAPGNARSLRALLRAGFEVVGGEVLLRPAAEQR